MKTSQDRLRQKTFWGVLFGVIIIAGVISLGIKSTRTQKSPPSRTPQETAQTQCITVAYTNYNKAKLAMFQTVDISPSVGQIIAERRLQEQYCLQFARCMMVANTNGQLAGLQFASFFDSCLRDEALEQYDAVSHSGD
jgi:hypothetical protein